MLDMVHLFMNIKCIAYTPLSQDTLLICKVLSGIGLSNDIPILVRCFIRNFVFLRCLGQLHVAACGSAWLVISA